MVLAIAVPFIYIHLLEGSPPPKFALSSTGASGGPSVPLDGTWGVAPGSEVGYRVGEVLVGQNNTAVGRTSNVTGRIVISGNRVTSADFTVDMTSVKSDEPSRDRQFQGRIMDTAQYPRATFSLAKSINFGTPPANGVTEPLTATGNLTLRGVAATVTFNLTVRHTGAEIQALAQIPITFATWKIPTPSFGSFVTTADHGILELLLDFTKGPGQALTPVATGSSSGDGPGSAAEQAYQACLTSHGATVGSGGGGGGGYGPPPGASGATGVSGGAYGPPAGGSGAGYGPPAGGSGTAGVSGGPPTGGPGGSGGTPSPATQAAMAACSSLRPASTEETPPTISPTTVPPLGY